MCLCVCSSDLTEQQLEASYAGGKETAVTLIQLCLHSLISSIHVILKAAQSARTQQTHTQQARRQQTTRIAFDDLTDIQALISMCVCSGGEHTADITVDPKTLLAHCQHEKLVLMRQQFLTNNTQPRLQQQTQLNHNNGSFVQSILAHTLIPSLCSAQAIPFEVLVPSSLLGSMFAFPTAPASAPMATVCVHVLELVQALWTLQRRQQLIDMEIEMQRQAEAAERQMQAQAQAATKHISKQTSKQATREVTKLEANIRSNFEPLVRDTSSSISSSNDGVQTKRKPLIEVIQSIDNEETGAAADDDHENDDNIEAVSQPQPQQPVLSPLQPRKSEEEIQKEMEAEQERAFFQSVIRYFYILREYSIGISPISELCVCACVCVCAFGAECLMMRRRMQTRDQRDHHHQAVQYSLCWACTRLLGGFRCGPQSRAVMTST
jgi:hypothetical protein